MQTTEQYVKHYWSDTPTIDIIKDMKEKISRGWKVHTCFERDKHVIVVYETELKTWN